MDRTRELIAAGFVGVLSCAIAGWRAAAIAIASCPVAASPTILVVGQGIVDSSGANVNRVQWGLPASADPNDSCTTPRIATACVVTARFTRHVDDDHLRLLQLSAERIAVAIHESQQFARERQVPYFMDYLKRHEVEHEGRLLPGRTARNITIEAFAKRHDLIIMGASERSLLASLLTGNPVEEVLRETPCDLIILKPRHED